MTREGAGAAPRVTVLLPVRDGEATLAEAIESVLGQTWSDFELLVIDDGSRDGSAEIAAGFADPRVRLVRNAAPKALIHTLNLGLELARGEIVARMDADDVSLPRRLERQVDFLDAHPDVAACGTWVETFGAGGGAVWRLPETPDEVRCRLLFDAALAHPSVCLRRERFAALGLRYDARALHAEDYDLWARASDRLALANVGEVLLRYRVHPANVSARHRREQEQTVARIRRERLARLGLAPTADELAIHAALAAGGAPADVAPLKAVARWLETLLRANRGTAALPRDAFERLLGQLWLAAVHRTLDAGEPALRAFRSSAVTGCVPVAERFRVLTHAARCAIRD